MMRNEGNIGEKNLEVLNNLIRQKSNDLQKEYEFEKLVEEVGGNKDLARLVEVRAFPKNELLEAYRKCGGDLGLTLTLLQKGDQVALAPMRGSMKQVFINTTLQQG